MWNLHSVCNPDSPLPCNLTQVPGMKTWTSLEGAFFCHHRGPRKCFLFKLEEINELLIYNSNIFIFTLRQSYNSKKFKNIFMEEEPSTAICSPTSLTFRSTYEPLSFPGITVSGMLHKQEEFSEARNLGELAVGWYERKPSCAGASLEGRGHLGREIRVGEGRWLMPFSYLHRPRSYNPPVSVVTPSKAWGYFL